LIARGSEACQQDAEGFDAGEGTPVVGFERLWNVHCDSKIINLLWKEAALKFSAYIN
jgi:hypothetical protein